MSKGDGELVIALGSLLIIAGIFPKTFFKFNLILHVSDKQKPSWIGRLLCGVVGGMMILFGLNAVFPPR